MTSSRVILSQESHRLCVADMQISTQPFTKHACHRPRGRKDQDYMVVGAGSLRFLVVLWTVLLHQTTASGRIL